MLRGTCFVDHVDRLVGQFAVVDVASGQFDRHFDRFSRILDAVILFEIRLEPLQNLDCVWD